MKVLYLSHLDDAQYSTLVADVRVGDVLVSHTANSVCFFMVKNNSSLFDNALERVLCDMKKMENQTLLSDNMNCQNEAMINLSKVFGTSCIKAFFDNMRSIANSETSGWDGQVIMNLMLASSVDPGNVLEDLFSAGNVKSQSVDNTDEACDMTQSIIEAYPIDTPNDEDEGILFRPMDLEVPVTYGRYTLSQSEDNVVVKHSTLGTQRFHAVRVYKDNHILGWIERNGNPMNFVIMSDCNRTSSFSSINTTCFAGYHVAFKMAGGAASLIDFNAKEIFPRHMRWNNVLHIHSGFAFCQRNDNKFLVKVSLFNQYITQLGFVDDAVWQKDSIFFVKKDSKWHVFNGDDYYRQSKGFAQVKWISDELVCGFDGLNYYIINPYESVTMHLYEGTCPSSYLKTKKRTERKKASRRSIETNEMVSQDKMSYMSVA